jgi:hypothetical protein
MNVDDRIKQAKRDYLNGRIVADSSGYISVGGLTFKAPPGAPTAMATRPAAQQIFTKYNARETWDRLVAEASVKTRGNRQSAINAVVRANPGLREALITGANEDRQQAKPVSRQSTTKPRAMSKQQFDEQLQKLIESGLSKREAALQLSKSMGLSQERTGPNYFQDGKQRYFR